jgi:hypothetical protein
MGDNPKSWKLETAGDVAEALDWLRRRMGASGLVLIAIGINTVAVCKDAKISPADAADLVESELPTLKQGFAQLQTRSETRGFLRRGGI